MKSIFQRFLGLFKRNRRIRLEEIGRKLSPSALAAIEAEAAFLRNAHRVRVDELQKGENAGKPRAVDDAVEARLSEQAPQA